MWEIMQQCKNKRDGRASIADSLSASSVHKMEACITWTGVSLQRTATPRRASRVKNKTLSRMSKYIHLRWCHCPRLVLAPTGDSWQEGNPTICMASPRFGAASRIRLNRGRRRPECLYRLAPRPSEHSHPEGMLDYCVSHPCKGKNPSVGSKAKQDIVLGWSKIDILALTHSTTTSVTPRHSISALFFW
jgi:hypothetical protein